MAVLAIYTPDSSDDPVTFWVVMSLVIFSGVGRVVAGSGDGPRD